MAHLLMIEVEFEKVVVMFVVVTVVVELV